MLKRLKRRLPGQCSIGYRKQKTKTENKNRKSKQALWQKSYQVIQASNSSKEIAGMSIKIGILGYGNLAKGVESAIMQNDDLELAAVFTRRDPASVKIRTEGVPVLSQDAAADKV